MYAYRTVYFQSGFKFGGVKTAAVEVEGNLCLHSQFEKKMRRSVSLILFLFSFCTFGRGERILMLSPLGTRSHIYGFMPIVEALAERGHQLTVVTAHKPIVTDNSANIGTIVLSDLVEQVEIDGWYDFKRHDSFTTFLGAMLHFRSTESLAYHVLMNNTQFKEIFASKSVDLIIVDAILQDFCLPLVDHLQVPFVYYSPSTGASFTLSAMGVAQEYANVPTMFGVYNDKMTFFQRMENMLASEIILQLRKIILLRMLDQVIRKDFPDARSIEQIERDAKLCLTNIHPVTAWVRSLPPNVIAVGAMHVRPPKPLPDVIQLFV